MNSKTEPRRRRDGVTEKYLINNKQKQKTHDGENFWLGEWRQNKSKM